MTVPSETNRSGPYNGNGVTTVFDYEFKITNENYIKVIKADAAGVETVLTIDADYVVTDVGNPAGGQVALTVPLPTGQTLTMIPNVPFTQEIDLENQGAYYAETVENGLDLATMRDQQLQEQINRAVQIPASEDPAQLEGLVGDILRLADSADKIDTVADNIADVNEAADNMAAIIAAPAQASAAAASAASASAAVFVANKWATEAEDVAVNDGVNPAGFSAFHWMRKALGYATSASASAIAAAASAASIALPAIVASTFLQAKADASGYETKTPTEVRNALAAAAFVVDRAALKALDPTKDKAATTYGEAGRNGTWVAYLHASLSANDQAAAVDDAQEGMFARSTANNLYTWVRQCRRQADIEMFGASPSATAAANSTAIQAAIDLCQKYSYPLRIPAGDYQYDSGLTVKNVLRLTGDGMFRSRLVYTGAFSAMFINPDATFANDNTGYYFADFSVSPSAQNGGTYGMIWTVAGTEYVSNSMVERCYIGQFGTQGFYFNNTGTTGGFFSLHINRCFIANGFKGNNVGDSVTIEHTTINAQGNFIGVFVTQASGAREFIIRDCNITCQGGGIQLVNTIGAKIIDTWVEQPSYWGDALGALGAQVLLSGTQKTTIRGCTFQPLAASIVSTAYALIVNGNDTVIEDTEFGIGETAHVNIVAGALRTQIRDGNSDIQNGTLTFADAEPTTVYGPKLQATSGKGIGYASGAGGAVVQATSKTTGVTLNKASGQVTMNAAALAAGTIVSFVLTNSAIAAGDVLILNHISGGTRGAYSLNASSAAGSATIDVRNNTAGSLSEAIVIAFAMVKAVTS
ncbi:hypothetical protein [Mesorhizobium sp. WSM3866]|uniref:hypothetical protein n=1 Tax=Mesorhizobium sp. WSM3866 TaxID=422271 RepID=UPI001AEC7B9A|nr:hypothetical protein [Mesorhizobium sp. WSM3866]